VKRNAVAAAVLRVGLHSRRIWRNGRGKWRTFASTARPARLRSNGSSARRGR
jgi:hypothetical protein